MNFESASRVLRRRMIANLLNFHLNERVSASPPNLGAGGQVLVPLTFKQWAFVNTESKDNDLSAEAALTFDIVDYELYLSDEQPFSSVYATRFRHLVDELRRGDRITFDFDANNPDIPSFKEWTSRTREKSTGHRNAETSGHERHITAVGAYAEILSWWPSLHDKFISHRSEIANIQRIMLNDGFLGLGEYIDSLDNIPTVPVEANTPDAGPPAPPSN
ncbi:hypothetical protein F5882DRAFT_465914 [Hyaloscypha sp. PMI_1271]|nr:hypothetical protein F5882DRAFT_465914 [Hyaloscypha sp. PMI_1271]